VASVARAPPSVDGQFQTTAAWHDLVHLGILRSGLLFVNIQREMADRIIVTKTPAPVLDPHEASSAELLMLVRSRLLEDATLRQSERLELVKLLRSILERLGQLVGRLSPLAYVLSGKFGSYSCTTPTCRQAIRRPALWPWPPATVCPD